MCATPNPKPTRRRRHRPDGTYSGDSGAHTPSIVCAQSRIYGTPMLLCSSSCSVHYCIHPDVSLLLLRCTTPKSTTPTQPSSIFSPSLQASSPLEGFVPLYSPNMTVIRGLVGLSFICTAAGFAGPISTQSRATGSSSSSNSFKSSARQQAPQLMKGWRSSSQRTRTCMTAQQEGDASEAAPAAPAPRLKRVRRRRKDGGASVAVAGEEEGKASAAVVEEQASPPASPPVAAASRVVAPPPAVVAPPAVPAAVEQVQLQQQRAAAVEEEAPRSVGGTKGTKVGVPHALDRCCCCCCCRVGQVVHLSLSLLWTCILFMSRGAGTKCTSTSSCTQLLPTRARTRHSDFCNSSRFCLSAFVGLGVLETRLHVMCPA